MDVSGTNSRGSDVAIMTSRLDRLFVLLESGSSSVTRKTAARQLGEVQRLHPHELHSLLGRIKTYLFAASWDTRIAAGQAIKAVIENVPNWDPKPITMAANEITSYSNSDKAKKLNLDKFDMNSVLKNGVHLTGSEGSEYDLQEKAGPCDVAKQKQILNAKIGLDVTDKIGIELEDIVSADDLITAPVDKQVTNFSGNFVGEMVQIEISQAGGLSIREKNRARRKARQVISKQRSAEGDEGDEPKRKKSKTEAAIAVDSAESTPDVTGSWGNATHWPFESFCDQLVTDLFNPRWESRHGAAIGLREIVTCHGEGAGKATNVNKQQMEEDHELWLQDMSLRLLCVLSLDRFGDFVSDQVVAPVRETCAQVLGAVIRLMQKCSVEGVLRIITQLLEQSEWEARHGGLLALKYILAVRKDLVGSILPTVLPLVMKHLSDEVDDVSAVAASSLIPVTLEIIEKAPALINDIIAKLWDLLLDQDDLAAACNSFMGLLAALLSEIDSKKYISSQPFSELLPRLWPFLSHNATSVRKSTLMTLKTLTAVNASCIDWTPELLQIALRHVYQRVLVEPDHSIQDLASQVWQNLLESTQLTCLLQASCPYFGTWLCLAMQNAKTPFDPSLLVPVETSRVTRRNGRPPESVEDCSTDQKLFLGGVETTNLDIRETNSVRARCTATKMLGYLSCYIVQVPPELENNEQEAESPVSYYVKVLLTHLLSKSALQRLVCGLVVCEWAKSQKNPIQPPELIERIHQCLNENVYFDEIGLMFTRLMQETKEYISILNQYKIRVEDSYKTNILSLDQIQELTRTSRVNKSVRKKTSETIEERRKNIFSSAGQLLLGQNALNIACQAALAGAVTELKSLPEKLNPVVKPLMESIRKEDNEVLQKISAEEIAHLMELCVNRSPCPNIKIISNICAFLCSDPEFTPRSESDLCDSDAGGSKKCPKEGWTILTLVNQQRQAERTLLKRQNSAGARGPGRPRLIVSEALGPENVTADDEVQKIYRIQRRGATLALEAIAKRFGVELPSKLPKLWSMVCCHPSVTTKADDLIMALQVLEVICLYLHKELFPELLLVLQKLCETVTHECNAVRHMSARCIASLAILDPEKVMETVVCTIVPLLAVTESDAKREGAAEAIACIVEKLQFDIIPYVVLLVIPLLGRMSDQNHSVRTICTQSFASLVQLLPLDNPNYDTGNLSREKEKERSFLQHLLNPKTIPDYVVPVPIKAELRPYQQAGVNWLSFLNKYKLHGILCDDMGLGKTLQSICILAGDHFHRNQEYMRKKSPDCKPLPSIVICPPTLTGHWVYEVEKFLSKEYLNPLQYSGPPVEREKLKAKVGEYNLIVASYDIVRKDIEFFKNIKWNYCILDEGHIIKNGKTKASKAIKTLTANHRLILSGTPIQNNVLELWSLFDFLMPGLLSTEKQFNARYSRPILASWDPKSSLKEQEAGVIAMESLHRQVLPFLLRRMKEDVLKDLPPKITQDYICELSPLQEELYEDFSRTEAHQSLQDSLLKPSKNNTHIFQALRYLQNVCNHPKLVLTQNHPEYGRMMAMLESRGTSVDDIQHACKLPALKQLLLDCGIGTSVANDMVYINHHRALIFCQLKSMLDIIENDLLEKHLPNVSYLRLDGTVPPSQRHGVVNKFNNDPSIDVLLLTTQVGGLGLNLTGADTVIFVEHDWNPMKDLQAMDRAHRIGQKKVVNVYRLITRGTLEEKIMGLQKFKLLTANTVISDENGAIETMATDQLLDLFTLKDSENKSGVSQSSNNSSNPRVPGIPVRGLLDSLPELWEQQQYETEFDLTTFMSNLNKSKHIKSED